MARSVSMSPVSLAEAVRSLRTELRLTQQEFASRLGVAVISVARYESKSTPSREMLARLARLANSAGNADLAAVFTSALSEGNENESSLRPGEPLNDQEMVWMAALQQVMRNAEVYEAELAHIEEVLAKPIADMRRLFEESQRAANSRRAIIRLVSEGRSHSQIAELFGLNENDVSRILALDRIDELRPSRMRAAKSLFRGAVRRLTRGDAPKPDIVEEALDHFEAVVPKVLIGQGILEIAKELNTVPAAVELIATTLKLQPGDPKSLETYITVQNEAVKRNLEVNEQERAQQREERRKRLKL